jgi:ABC-type nitrate/sulfonate/bicarbonate transport system permease component
MRTQTDLALACIAVLCVVGLVLYGCVTCCEKLVMRWYDTR